MKNKALQILLDYDTLEPQATPVSDFGFARDEGYMFDDIAQTHDEAMDIALAELGNCNKMQITNLFLASLSTHNLDWRIGLSAFAIMRVCPPHRFTPQEENKAQEYCRICGSINEENVDRNFINQTRFTDGGIVGYEVYDFAFLLAQHNKLPDVKPEPEDFRIFRDIIDLAAQSADDEKPNSLQKKLRTIKGLRSNEEERRRLLETLGLCGILETEKHKGFLTGFTNLGLAPKNGRSSDWLYPVDWWRGKDGLNRKAFDFWFGDYDELK